MFIKQTEGIPFLVYIASVVYIYFLRQSLYVVLAVLELVISTMLALNSEILLPLPPQLCELKV